MEEEKGKAIYQHKLGDTCKITVIFLSIQETWEDSRGDFYNTEVYTFQMQFRLRKLQVPNWDAGDMDWPISEQ